MISCIKENYQSRFSGTEIDERLALAHTALQGIIANGERLLPIEGVVTLDYATDEEIEALKTAMNTLLAIVETKANKDALEALSVCVDTLVVSSATKAEVAVLAATIDSAIIAIQGKQDKLIAGENITIDGNVISATGGMEEIRKHTRVLTVDCEERILDYCTSIEDLSEKYALINVTYVSDNKNLIGASILPSNDVEKGWLYEYMTGWRLCKVGGFSISDTSTFADLADYLDAHSDNIVSRALTGDPADLKTSFKSDLVGAINEVKDTMDARHVVLNIKLGAVTPEGTIITNAAKVFNQVYNAPEGASFYVPDPQKSGKTTEASIFWLVRGAHLQISVYEGAVTKLYQIMQDASTSQFIGMYKEENPLLAKADKTDVQTLQEDVEELHKTVDLKAFTDGYYVQMRVGLTDSADNLTPRGEAIDAEFTERIAGGGMSITDSSSKYEEVRGNSVVWNQLVDAGDFSYRTPYSTSIYTLRMGATNKTVSIIEGHIYLISAMVDRSIEGNDQINIYLFSSTTADSGGAYFIAYNGTPNGYKARVFTATASLSGTAVQANNYSGKRGYDEGDSIALSNLCLIDLTQMFGEGKEPTSYEEFLQRKPMVADEYAYNEGTIVNNKVEGIKTTDADGNEIGRLDLSWIKDIKDEGGVALFEDGLKSVGSVFDVVAAKKAIKRLAVVDLGSIYNWKLLNAGYFEGTLGTFAKGSSSNLLCIGFTGRLINSSSVYDKTIYISAAGAIRLVDSELSASDIVNGHIEKLEGQYLIYELANPIEVEYSEKNMTIPVVSGGMEIAVAETPSSPLKARIVYGMDAYQQIVANKNNVGSLASLATADKSSLVAAINELAARIASLQSSTNITE